MKKFQKLYKRFNSIEGSLFSYAFAFSILFSIPPLLLIMTLLSKYSAFDFMMVYKWMHEFLWVDQNILREGFQYFNNQIYTLPSFIFTLITSCYLASRSLYSLLLICASQQEIDVPKWSIRLHAIILFMTLLLWICLMMMFFHYIQMISFVTWIPIFLFFYILYRLTSLQKTRITYGLLGSSICTIGIWLFTYIFNWSVQYFTSYSQVYGPLASFVTLLLAIYLISCMIYFGFCLNQIWEEHHHKHVPKIKHASLFLWAKRISAKIKSLFIKNGE